jgi:hypothetical protein
MKKAFRMSLLILLNWTMQAQPQMPDPVEVAKKQTERMKKELVLTDAQTTKVSAINLKYTQQQRDVMEEIKQSRNFSVAKTKMDALDLAKNEEVTPLLNAEQQKKWKKLRKKMKDDMRPSGAPPMMMN